MPDQLIEGYKRFRDGYFKENHKELIDLAQGQSPRVAIISCCDSRVDPTIIFDANPGDLFVVRNVANLVPPCRSDGKERSTSAALEFAVTGLQVKHIVVLGHAQCGGIKALMDHDYENDTEHSFISNWMKVATPVRKDILARNLEGEEKYTACEHTAIAHSLDNLMTFPWIKERVETGNLTLHGWYYDLEHAELHIYDAETKEFDPL